MIKIFFIHSFALSANVKEITRELKTLLFPIRIKFTVLRKHSTNDWKSKASKQISSSHVVLVIRDEHSKNSPNILFEIKKAQTFKKPICEISLFNCQNHEFTSYTYYKSVQNCIDASEFIKDIYNAKTEFPATLFPKVINIEKTADISMLFEQYKIMLNTSEQLVERRNKTNTFFLSANGFLVSALGLLTYFKDSSSLSFAYLSLTGIVGILLCIAWKSLLESYGKLNKGKFRVINELEKLFPSSPFAAEWVALGKGEFPTIYKSFTESEGRIPYIFSGVYFIYIFCLICWYIKQTIS